MIFYPAIDLKGGQCVRLKQGDMEQATVFNSDPADQARQFVEAGADWLHLVDLDGAFAGQPVNAAAVEAILASAKLPGRSIPCQLGGGIRDMARIAMWLEKGVARIILGTVALKNPDLVREACKAFPGKIAVGIDARGGRVAVEGWAETADITALDLALKFEDAGVAALIYTDIDRDGLLQGVNVTATAELASALSIPVIASGGVSNLQDLEALLRAAPATRGKGGGISGVISGRALYDGRLDLREALALLRQAA
ncbi:1-(5-phosphoribosyl)-5-[(5-phosphoribosylamino)methylideneamino]imidazole-4-carboxamide isomerase [Dongia soli]|uniref:1-(5-phosphoribosyl)-5-[(5-phosphoribosylamino)methylideneamino] imidazole-4-carboxamide isomerase n=1 Tax=Dongia soli TaxID=600628 RepID=A0ABU5E6S6_9PROT|nr:1-(5-phosphoribosyl)-5-[(5-phosphoribosylamino)methylideneamino]imidazole-4-carboxamide isomerase [Dongia soli]MDY0882012.1 1-(5-phosphoribosyl)-5-[(5-phosphoribosylamino)methylideneamino]imidazole-4-carboxamide isomerase [Dongia soli]